ncbi:SMC-Scp complex subunit ScpB [Kribbella sp. NBC_00382]|uniref:SMC-Scp complex subunit ScpB n=1 Tax=Kribbella sp. NBC_00382 TaxID=2975967 RepID=UPI002E1FEA45
MTDNQTETDLQESADAATADALASVTTTETADSVEAVQATEEPTADEQADDVPADDKPAEDASAEDVPVEGEAADDATAEGVAVDEASAEGVPAEGDVGALLDEVLDDVVVGEDAIDDVTMRRALEAILMVSDEPLPVLAMAKTVGRTVADVSAALVGLSGEYTEQGRGFDLREVGGGWRYYTREDTAQYVEGYVLEGQQARLTQAALETLAVVAYKQPVSRARVSAIRGVNVDGVMRTLISRGLLEEAGPDTESQSTLYRTTSYFLERMGMQSLDDLPELAPYLPEMDDMEEELAAQAAASAEPSTSEDDPTTSEDDAPLENDLAPPTPSTAETDDEPTDDEPTDEAEPTDGVVLADDVELADDEPTNEAELADARSADEDEPTDEDELDDAEVESSDEAEPADAVELDDAEVELSDEVGSTGGAEASDEDEPAEEAGSGAGDLDAGGVVVEDETVDGPGLGGSGESKSGTDD